MVNESDTSYRPDYFANVQPGARDLPKPTFGRSQDIRGGNVKHVRSVAWSCDGRKAATGGEFKELVVWDAKTVMDSKASISLPSSSKPSPHNGHVGAVAWSPIDPNILISGDKGFSSGGTIAIWDIRSPSTPAATFKIAGDILHIAFHPSGRQFAVVCPKSRDEVFFFWKTVVDGEEKWSQRDDIALGGSSMDIGSEEINSLRFTNSGKLVCAVSNDGSINAWLYPTQTRIQPQRTVETALDTEVGAIESGPSTSPSTPKAAADEDAPLTGKSRAASREGSPEDRDGPKDDVDMAQDREGEKAEGDGGEAVDSEAKEEEGAPVASNQDVEMAEPQDPEIPAIVEPEGARTVTESASAAPSRRPTPPPVPAASSSAESEQEMRRSKQLYRFRHAVCHSASLLSLSFDPMGKYLAVGGQDALLSVFDTRDWICERTFDICTAAIRQSAFSHDGEYIALGGDDTFIAIVSLYSGALVARVPVQGTVNALAWHPRRNWLAYSTSSKTASPIWHVVHQEQ